MMKKLILTMLFAACLASCDLFDLLDTEEEQFYAMNMVTETPYTLRAKKLAEGKKCVIWAENGSGVTKEKAAEIAARYDNDIRPKIVSAFGMKDITVTGADKTTQYHFDDILDYANALAGKDDKKLTILLLDIKDDFNGTTKQAFVAGYFSSGNFYSKKDVSSSNECDMIYVDTYPSLSSKYPQLEQRTYSTFAHELQHLINFTTTLLVERKNSKGEVSVMDTWIDEGLSSQAEQIFFGENIKDHCTQFNKSETIAKGNNFFVWGDNPDAILDEYATVYLFFRWLSLHAEAKGIQNFFLDIITSKDSDYRVITTAANKLRQGKWNNWETLLGSWFSANYYPDNTDYGYKDRFFYTGDNKIKVKPLTAITSTPLYPGEGVYSVIKSNSYQPPSTSGNIRYAALDKGPEKALLTFNANTDNKATKETGSLTGVAASVSSAPNSRALTAEDAQTYNGPYVIDARDYSGIFGRNK